MKLCTVEKRICFVLTVVICCLFLSIVLCKMSKSQQQTYIKFEENWHYNKHCYFLNQSERNIEAWSASIQNLIKEYNVPVFVHLADSKQNLELSDYSLKTNISKVLNYSVNKKADDLVLNYAESGSSKCNPVITDVPVIVTAGSTQFLPRFRNLFTSIKKNLLPHYKNLRVIFYNLGMTDDAIVTLKYMCPQCEIRHFPFHMFPNYCLDDLKNYIWKPLIIHRTLQEFDLVMWVDSSVEFRGGKEVFDNIFQRAKTIGLQLVSLSSIPKDLGSLADMTKTETFRFLNESEEYFNNFPEVEANRLIFKRTPFVMNAIIRPWVGCALTKNCMGDKHTRLIIICNNWAGPIPVRFILKTILGYDICHRFDQSVLSIILTRIFGKYRHLVHTKYHREWIVNKIKL